MGNAFLKLSILLPLFSFYDIKDGKKKFTEKARATEKDMNNK